MADSLHGQLEKVPNRLMQWGVLALLFVLALLSYSHVLGGGFLFLPWDDDINISANPHMTGLNAESIHWMFTDVSYVRRYNPLAWFSWAVNYQLGGLNPWGYHATNVVLHGCNTVLLFWLLKRLCVLRVPDAGAVVLVVVPAMGALLWALHPLRVEGVAWLAGRLYVLTTFFLLLSLLCYLRAAMDVQRVFSRKPLYWMSVLAFAASLLTHQIAILYVCLLIVLDIYLLQRLGAGKWCDAQALHVWLEKLPYLLVGASVLLVAYWARLHASGIWEPPPSWQSFPASARIMQVLYMLSHYVWRPWWPFGNSPVYTTLVTENFFSGIFILNALLSVSLTVGAFLSRRRYPVLWMLWCCHLLLLFPAAGWFEHPHYPTDRYSYMQGMLWSALFCVLALWLWPRLRMARARSIALALAVVLMVFLGMRTLEQQTIWKNGEQLFKYMIAVLGDDPYRMDMHLRLVKLYQGEQRWELALQHIDEAIRIRPDAAQFYGEKGNILMQMKGALAKQGAAAEQQVAIGLEAESALEKYRQLKSKQ
jgi:hypothetical protein